MLDRTIPFYNTIMKCSDYTYSSVELPDGSWKAILLYLSLGFKLQKSDTFSHYVNEFEKAISELKKIVSKEQFELLLRSSED